MNDIPVPVEPIEFCVIKRSAVSLYSLRERLFFQKVHHTVLLVMQKELISISERKYHSLLAEFLHDVPESTFASLTGKTMA